MRKRRMFTNEFKLEAAKLVESSGVSPSTWPRGNDDGCQGEWAAYDTARAR